MPSYRIEAAKQGRAGCKNKECKDNDIKIGKGELRFGSLVTIKDHSSWAWKHWGCTTPAQIENLKEISEGDTDLIDGYDELPEEMQEKVVRALDQGHVDDEDWKGDVECNRPGMKGMRQKTPKKKAAKEDVKDEAAEGSGSESPTKSATKKRGRAKRKDEEEAPAAKKSKGRAKKAAKDADEDEGPETVPKPKRGRAKKTTEQPVEPSSEAVASPVEEPEAPVKAKRGRKKAAAATTEKPVPQKRGRKSSKKSTFNDEEDED